MSTPKTTSADIPLTERLKQLGYSDQDIAEELALRSIIHQRTWADAVNIPPRFRDASFENYVIDPNNRAAYNTLIKTVKNYNGEWIYIMGPTGVGKTHLAYAIAKELANQGYWPRILKWSEIVRDMINVLRGEGYSLLSEDYRNKRPLIIDDFGSTEVGGYLADGVRDKTLELVDYRYDYQIPLIVTTNLTPLQIETKYGSRVASRLMSGVRLQITGEDRRTSL